MSPFVLSQLITLATEVAPPPHATPLHGLIQGIATAGILLLVGGIVLCLYRMVRGPSLPDRVMASDVLTFQVVGLVLLMALVLRNTAFFDVMLIVAILGFVNTVAFSQYMGASTPEPAPPDDTADPEPPV